MSNPTQPPADFVKLWNLLAVAYPGYGKEQGAEAMAQTLKLYWRLLADIPLAHLQQAALRHIAASRFFPTVAELREAAATLAQAPGQTALEAWGEVVAAMGDARYYVYADHYRVPEFANPVTNRLIASMGWRELCHSENAIADRARFTAAYDTLQDRQRREASLPEQLQAGAAAPEQLNAPARVRQLTAAVTNARRLQE